MSEGSSAARATRARRDQWQQIRGRRRRRRPHPPCRPCRLGGDVGAADLVPRRTRAGIFAHNQADWYVEEVLDRPRRSGQDARSDYVDWRVAPLEGSLLIDWSKLTLSNELERQDIVGGAIDPRIRPARGDHPAPPNDDHRSAIRSLRTTRLPATSPTTSLAGRWTSPPWTASPAPKPPPSGHALSSDMSWPAWSLHSSHRADLLL